ncbi:hypothetical protein LPJ56_000773 [Coemansia sp. RSA 2599]|nr:hypothetical protein LPJ75_000406 [Coemansia sp. RSA 2598]KAJ1828916.1 hypothetical protein LPJ56_000773 [Coemansia sp. RSA 2599]
MACTCNCAAKDAAAEKTTVDKAVQTDAVVTKEIGVQTDAVATKEIGVQTDAVATKEIGVQTEPAKEAVGRNDSSKPIKAVRVFVTLRTKGRRCLGYIDMKAESKVSDIKPHVVKGLSCVKKYKVKTLLGKDVSDSDILESYTGMDSLEVTVLNRRGFLDMFSLKRKSVAV